MGKITKPDEAIASIAIATLITPRYLREGGIQREAGGLALVICRCADCT